MCVRIRLLRRLSASIRRILLSPWESMLWRLKVLFMGMPGDIPLSWLFCLFDLTVHSNFLSIKRSTTSSQLAHWWTPVRSCSGVGRFHPYFPKRMGTFTTSLHYITGRHRTYLTNVANIVVDEDICMDLLQHFGLCPTSQWEIWPRQASAVPAPEIPDENSVYQTRKVLGDPFACCLFDVLE